MQISLPSIIFWKILSPMTTQIFQPMTYSTNSPWSQVEESSKKIKCSQTVNLTKENLKIANLENIRYRKQIKSNTAVFFIVVYSKEWKMEAATEKRALSFIKRHINEI